MTTPGEEILDCRMPGGGSMYYLQRVDRKGPDGKTKKLLLCLGAGGFAATLDGIKVVAGQRVPVAIKHVAMDKRSADMFEKYEMRGIESLTGRMHPNLVKFIGYFKGEDGDGRMRLNFIFERCPTAIPYLVDTETTSKGFIVPGLDISSPDREGCDLVNNPILMPPMHPLEARYILKQVLAALVYLHDTKPNQIIHRDVKPGNVLIWGCREVDREGHDSVSSTAAPQQRQQQQAGQATAPTPTHTSISGRKSVLKMLEVKLTDYGTVRRMDNRDLTVGQGTKAFMAPEVEVQTGTGRNAKPIGSYDTSVDVFSAGATFFYLITGQTPDGNTRKPWAQRFGSDVKLSAIVDKATGHVVKIAKVPSENAIGEIEGMGLFEKAALRAQRDAKHVAAPVPAQAASASGAAAPAGLPVLTSPPGSPRLTGVIGGAGSPRFTPAAATGGGGSAGAHKSNRVRHRTNDLLARLERLEAAGAGSTGGAGEGSHHGGSVYSGSGNRSGQNSNLAGLSARQSSGGGGGSGGGRSGTGAAAASSGSGSGVTTPSKGQPSASASSSGSTAQPSSTTAATTISLLDYYFPPGSKQRLFLEGLVHKGRKDFPPPPESVSTAPGPDGAPQLPPTERRWTAKEALGWLEANWTST